MFPQLNLHHVEINGETLAILESVVLAHTSLADSLAFTKSNATPLHEVTNETQACCALCSLSGSTLSRLKSSPLTFVSSSAISVSASAHSSAGS